MTQYFLVELYKVVNIHTLRQAEACTFLDSSLLFVVLLKVLLFDDLNQAFRVLHLSKLCLPVHWDECIGVDQVGVLVSS